MRKVVDRIRLCLSFVIVVGLPVIGVWSVLKPEQVKKEVTQQSLAGEEARAALMKKQAHDARFAEIYERRVQKMLSHGYTRTGRVSAIVTHVKVVPPLTLSQRVRELLGETVVRANLQDTYDDGGGGDSSYNEYWDENSDTAGWTTVDEWGTDNYVADPDSNEPVYTDWGADLSGSDEDNPSTDMEISWLFHSNDPSKTYNGISCGDQAAIGAYQRHETLVNTGIGAVFGGTIGNYGPGTALAGAVFGAAGGFLSTELIQLYNQVRICYMDAPSTLLTRPMFLLFGGLRSWIV